MKRYDRLRDSVEVPWDQPHMLFLHPRSKASIRVSVTSVGEGQSANRYKRKPVLLKRNNFLKTMSLEPHSLVWEKERMDGVCLGLDISHRSGRNIVICVNSEEDATNIIPWATSNFMFHPEDQIILVTVWKKLRFKDLDRLSAVLVTREHLERMNNNIYKEKKKFLRKWVDAFLPEVHVLGCFIPNDYSNSSLGDILCAVVNALAPVDAVVIGKSKEPKYFMKSWRKSVSEYVSYHSHYPVIVIDK